VAAAQRRVYFIDPLIAQLAHRRNTRFATSDSTKLNEQQSAWRLSTLQSDEARAP
jgi:hypothetical protein